MEVPYFEANWLKRTLERMASPGAYNDKKVASFEKLDMESELFVDPTLTAVEIHPGALRAST